jgi:hypothetical protein
VTTASSGSWLASPPQPVKAARPGLGTRRSGRAVERWWRKGSDTEEEEGSVYGSALKEVTGGRAYRGARGGGQDLATADLARPTRSLERAELVEVVAAVVYG